MRMWKIKSGWLEVEYDEQGNPYFVYEGKKCFLSSFVRCHNNPWGNMNVPDYIHAYDAENYYDPMYIEVASDGDKVKVYEQVESNANPEDPVDWSSSLQWQPMCLSPTREERWKIAAAERRVHQRQREENVLFCQSFLCMCAFFVLLIMQIAVEM